MDMQNWPASMTLAAARDLHYRLGAAVAQMEMEGTPAAAVAALRSVVARHAPQPYTLTDQRDDRLAVCMTCHVGAGGDMHGYACSEIRHLANALRVPPHRPVITPPQQEPTCTAIQTFTGATLPALNPGDYLSFTRTDGSVGEGTVAEVRGSVIRYRNAVGGGPRWVDRAEVSSATVVRPVAAEPAP